MRNNRLLLFFLFLSFFIYSCNQYPETTTTTTTCMSDWTVMAYIAGDNNLEYWLTNDIEEMVKGTNNKMRIIVLFDTQYQTKMYEITKNNKKEIYGNDIFPEIKKDCITTINSGNPEYLKKFIAFCKNKYNTSKYCLIIGGHGNGVYEDSSRSSEPLINKNIAVDYTSQHDWIYTSELTSTLTIDESVDLLVLDVCIGAFIETLYEYRPRNDGFYAKYALISLVEQRDTGFPYDMIFSQVTPTISTVDFGNLIVQQKLKYDKDNPWYTYRTNYQADAFIDISKIESIKNQIDNVVPFLANEQAKQIYEQCVFQTNEYNNFGLMSTTRDAYQIFINLANWTSTEGCPYDLSDEVKSKCNEIANLIAESVVSSFIQGTSPYYYEKPFESNKNGLTMFAPINVNQWKAALSYNAINTFEILETDGPGQLAWCIDNATIDDYQVQNWFELLDYYYDTDENLNGYHY